MRRLLLRSSLALVVLGCGRDLDGSCPHLDCEGGARLTIRGMRARPDASYVFRLVTDGETFVWRCKIVEGIPCKALTLLPVDASGDPDGWRLSFAPGDDGEPRIWVLGFRDRWMIGPESIELRVTVDGAALFERSWTPDYDGLDPSEPGCGGCEAWATSIALDAPARDA